MRWIIAALLLLAGEYPVAASQLVVHFSDDHGNAVSDAVVTLAPDAPVPSTSASPAPAAVTHIVDQKDETFIPYVQIFRPGDSVVFRNSDTTRHHVYSFSDARKFEFMLHPGENSPAIVLEKSGITAVGCNIHDQMAAYLFVSRASAIALSDKAGNAVLADIPAGSYTAHVWHPQLHPGREEPPQNVTIAAGAAAVSRLTFKLSLVPDPRESMDMDHVKN